MILVLQETFGRRDYYSSSFSSTTCKVQNFGSLQAEHMTRRMLLICCEIKISIYLSLSYIQSLVRIVRIPTLLAAHHVLW